MCIINTTEVNDMKKVLVIILLTFGFTQSTFADVCDYRPSEIIGGGATSVVAGSTGAAAATGVGMKAAGIYAFVHSTSGLTMLGLSTTGGAAAGGGILAGTAGVIGTIGAALMSPFVIIPAAITAVGIGSLEGICYFSENKESTNMPTNKN